MPRTKPAASRSVLVTGASSGIGRAAAKLFHERGWRVLATMRDPSAAPGWMAGDRWEVLPLDVTDRLSIDHAVKEALAAVGRIDVLLNNAGYGLNGPLEGATEAQMHHQFDVNVFGLVRVTQAVLPSMRAARSGLILNVSSIGGLIGMPVAPLYIATKHAVEGLSESLRFELKPFGVRVKLIEPGGIKTDFLARSAKWTEHPDYVTTIAAAKAMTEGLNDNLADPADVARVILRAAEDRSDRLRYLAKPGPYVAMHRALPDRVWRGMIEGALAREARRRPAASAATTARA